MHEVTLTALTAAARRMLWLATLLASMLAAGPVWAEAADPQALRRARALYRQAVAQFDGGEPDAALHSFRESYGRHILYLSQLRHG